MLPEIISNNLASLQPHKVRYAMSAMMEFTEEGVRVATDVFKSRDQEPPPLHVRRSRRVSGRKK